MITKVGEKTIQVVKLCRENRIHDVMNKSTTKNLKRTKIHIKLQNINNVKNKVNKFELKTTSKVVYTQAQSWKGRNINETQTGTRSTEIHRLNSYIHIHSHKIPK